jgi:hypothetical protein
LRGPGRSLGGATQRPRLARPAALALLAAGLAGLGLGLAAPARAGWSRPQRIAGPYSLDLAPAQVAFSATGQAAFGFGVENEDHAATSEAIVAPRSRSGRLAKPRRIPGAQQVLDLVFDGGDLSLLVGSSPSGSPCCSSAGLVKVVGGAPRRPRTVVAKLTGAAVGRLLPLPGGRLLSAVATAEGVWVQQAGRSGRPAPARRLTPAESAPQTLAATTLKANRTLVGWTAAAAQPAPAPVADIVVAAGSARRAPARPHVALTVAAGHQIDELALGRARSGATAAWIESWYDAKDVLHSQAAAADLAGRVRVRAWEIDGQLASGLSFATGPEGAQLLAWKVCDLSGSCSVEAVTRDSGRRFGAPIGLGRIDPSQAPAAALSPRGAGLVGWIDRGHVMAAARARRAPRFLPPRVVSPTNFAADLTIGFGAARTAIAAWTQGTFAQSVVEAVFKGP